MKKILVIDDAEYILESTSTLLRFEGYEVDVANDGMEGIEIAKKFKPDLILCDISMPRLDGYGVLDHLRTNSNTDTVPFIFLTAFTEKSNMRTGMEKDADNLLVKTYTRDELIAAIDAQWVKYNRIEKQVHEKVQEVSKNVTMALPHEFRTVLNEVIGTAKYLNKNADNLLSGDIKESSNDIISSSNRLLKITENFLIFSKIELIANNASKKQLLKNSTTVEPSTILIDSALLQAEKFQRKEDLILNNTINNISIVIASESFCKVIDELIDNAFRFSEPGTKVEINSKLEDNCFVISISDFGRGMTDLQIGNISAMAQFDRDIYEQQGIGLGLVIAKKMVEIHDGFFEISNKEGQGTKIRLGLPLLQA